MKLLERNGNGEPLGKLICVEAALMLEWWGHKGNIPKYSGLIAGLRECAEEISAASRRQGVVGVDKEIQL